MKKKISDRLFFQASAVFCFLLSAMTETAWSFKYTQDISVTHPGLTRCFLPNETTENYRVSEDLRLFSPDGQEVPYLFEYPEIERIGLEETIPRMSLRTQFLENSTVVMFSAPSSYSMSGFNVYTGVSGYKRMSVEQSLDGQNWDILAPQVGIGSLARISVDPPHPATTYRLTLDDSTTPPSSGIQVQWVRKTALAGGETIGVPFKKTGTSEFGERFELSAPRRNLYVESVSVFIADIANLDLNNVRATTIQLPTQEESKVEKHITAIVRLVLPGKGKSPYLSVSMGVASNNSRSVLYLKSHTGAPLQVSRMETRAFPRSILFLANQTGTYKLRFGMDGPATDPVLVYGREPLDSLFKRRKESGIHLATAGAVRTHAVFSKAMESPLWQPLSSSFDPQPFRYRAAVRVLRPGFQSADVPAEVFGVSSSEGEDWRLTANGREIPFLIRARSGRVLIKSRFEKLPPANGNARWELEGSFDQVPWINLRFDVHGVFKSTKARLISPEGVGEKVLLEFPWEFDERHFHKFLAESGRTVPIAREKWPTVLSIGSNGVPVQGRRLILEVDDASFQLPAPQVTGGTHKIIFKASPEDNILFYCGLDNPSSPDYPLRKDPTIPVTVSDQFAHFVPESLLINRGQPATGNDTSHVSPAEEKAPAPSSSNEPSPQPSQRKEGKWVSFGMSFFVLFTLLSIGYIILKK